MTGRWAWLGPSPVLGNELYLVGVDGNGCRVRVNYGVIVALTRRAARLPVPLGTLRGITNRQHIAGACGHSKTRAGM